MYIKHNDANHEMIVVLNEIDLPAAEPDKVKRQQIEEEGLA